MQLLYTKRSPYARKVRIVAFEKQIPLELIEEDLTKKSQRLLSANPLVKIPTLILDSGEALCDSPVICEYLDSFKNKPILIPAQRHFKILYYAAIADGLMDVAVAAYLEKIRHPEHFNEAFVKAQEETIQQGLRFFEHHSVELEELTLIPIATAAAIGYINFRLPQVGPQKTCPKLTKWFEEFFQRPSMELTKPA